MQLLEFRNARQRADAKEQAVRLHVQFAPESLVSKRRVAVALLRAIPAFYDAIKRPLVTRSVSPLLIKFLERAGFKSARGNDYIL
jgi:hypothetical protein